MQETFDVVVVGGGVLGVFHAWFAAERGLRTLLIERNELPRDASARNFGHLVASGMPPGPWRRRALESLGIYRELAPQAGFRLWEGGTQYVALTEAERKVLEEFAQRGPAEGYACQLLDGRQSSEANPVIDGDRALASLHFTQDLRVEPRQIFAQLLDFLSKEGRCEYRPRTVVTQVIARGPGCEVTTAAGDRLHCRRVFVCTGAEFRALLPQAFAESGLLRCKLQMLRTRPQEGLRMTTCLASGLSIRWYKAFRICESFAQLEAEPAPPGCQERGIHVLMVPDAWGGVVIGDSHAYTAGDVDDQDDPRTEAILLEYAQRMARLPHWEVGARWQGVYPSHPRQELFTATLDERIHIVTGIAGKGMTTGPAVARESLAKWIDGDPSGLDDIEVGGA